MAFGVTPEGFNRKRLEDIKTEIEQELRAKLGQNINLLPESVFGQIVGVQADREASVWELAESVYFSYYPSTSEGVQLDRVASINGVIRKTPTASLIDAPNQLLFGTPGTLVPQGRVISVLNTPTSRFFTLTDVTLVVGADEVQTLTLSSTPTSGGFTLNIPSTAGLLPVAVVFSDTAVSLQSKVDTALTTAGFAAGTVTIAGDIASGGPVTLTFSGDDETGFGKRDVALVTITSNTLSDGAAVTVVPTETTPGVPQGTVGVQAETTGAVVAPAGSLSVIETAVGGWDATVNILDAEVGQGVEEDPEFRLRREEQVAVAGAATRDAIIADVGAVEGVTAVVVFSNRDAITDLDGRPPHSVDIVAQGGDEDAIAEAIFGTVGDGIGMVGDITKVVKDSQNIDNTVKFSRPTEVDIWVEVDIVQALTGYPVDGDDQVKAAIVAYGQSLNVGQDVTVHGSDPSLECSIKDIPGVADVTFRVGKAVSPTTDDAIDIEPRELAIFDTSRITVSS